MPGVGDLGELSYGIFYLPSATFGYLAASNSQSLFELIPLWENIGLNSFYVLCLLTGFAFLGGVEAHGIARAIYGPDGPSQRPKETVVQIRHELAIVLGVEADEIPVVPCRIASNGFFSSALDYIQYLSDRWYLEYQASSRKRRQFERRNGKLTPKHSVETAFEQTTDIVDLLTKWKLIRIAYFLPIGTITWLNRISFALIALYGWFISVSYPLIILLFLHVILTFRSLLWQPIPNYVEEEALDDRFTPEYARSREE